MLKNKKLKTIFCVLEWLAWGVLMVVFLVVISPVLPFENIPKTYVVVTGSMEPTIKTGSVAIANRIDPKNIRKGDVIVFTSPSNPKENILHRVDDIKSTEPLSFSTKGDNNNAPDSWDVYAEGVKGVMVGQIPYLGHAAAFVRKPLGFGLLIVFPALVFIISQIFVIKKSIGEEIEKGIQKRIGGGIKGLILVGLLTSMATALIGIKVVMALFEDKVRIGGISLAVADFAPPDSPNLISPWDNSRVKSGSVVFRWSKVADKGSSDEPEYIFEICNDGFDGNQCIGNTEELRISAEDDNSSEDEIFISRDLEKGGNFVWRVRAVDSQGNLSAWSQVYQLSTFSVDRLTSVITNSYDDNTSKEGNKRIGYKAEAPEGVDKVDLCYRYNLGNWNCGGNYSSNNPEGSFDFVFDQGEGIYYFYTVASQGESNEDINSKQTEPWGLYKVQYDQTAPNSGVLRNNILGIDIYEGQDLIGDGGFTIDTSSEFDIFDPTSYLSGIWYGQGDGNFERVLWGVGLGDTFGSPSEGGMARIGFTGKLMPSLVVKNNRIFQYVDIPEKLSTTLSFKYRVISQDTVDNDRFRVSAEGNGGIMTILETGSDEIGDNRWLGDSGWNWYSKNLTGFSGQRIKLVFEIFDRDSETTSKDTWAFIDDVKLSTIDLRIARESEIIIDSHDKGSGVAEINNDISLNDSGDSESQYQAKDMAGNQESPQRDDRMTVAKVVLNEIGLNRGYDGYIELFRNDPSVESLDGWYLENISGETIPLDGGFDDQGRVRREMIDYPNFIKGDLDNPGEMKLIKVEEGGAKVIDQTKYQSEDDGGYKQWRRLPSGIGPWGMETTGGPKVEISVRVAAHKLLMSISSISNNLLYLNYEITYGEEGQTKGFGGEIDLEKVPDSKQIDREFYLGICSDNGKCVDDYVALGSEINVKVSYKIDDITSPDEMIISKVVMFQ